MVYAWKTKNRSGTSSTKPNYAVTWEWRYPEFHDNYDKFIDMTFATDAERAISKVRKTISNEFKSERRDVIILECRMMNGDGNG